MFYIFIKILCDVGFKAALNACRAGPGVKWSRLLNASGTRWMHWLKRYVTIRLHYTLLYLLMLPSYRNTWKPVKVVCNGLSAVG